jgi:TonB-linked outer membrane protein, SusC/RagA family
MRFKQNACCAPEPRTKSGIILLAIAFLSTWSLSASAHPSNTKTGYFFQDTTVLRGKVTGAEEGGALSPVSVQNLVTLRGTTTNLQGEFALGVRRGDSIRFTFAGKTPRTVIYQGEKFLDIQLTSSDRLSEVVVTGYQTIEKSRFGGAAATVKMEDIKMNGQTDISRMLEGRAAGVSVQNISGTFGTAPKVRVRGATSINGDNKPLWVVDGVVLEDIVNISNDQLSSGDPTTLLGSSVAGLNANDIESFDILKDAAAAALYGARAMNGVVVITTKKGKSGKPVINYNGNFSTFVKPFYSEYNIMNSGQQMAVYAELYNKGSLNSNILDAPDNGVFGKMYQLINQWTDQGWGLENIQQARKEFLVRYGRANTDWFDILFRNNLQQEHSVSIATGTDRSQTYFSTSFYGDNGWTIADKVNRYTVNFRNSYKFNEKLSADFTTVGSVRQQKAPGSLTRQPNPVSGQYERDFDINPFSYALNTSRTLTAFDENGNREYFSRNFAPFNILSELENNYIDLNVVDVRLQGGLNYKIMPGLKYEFVGALRYVKSSREHQITERSNMANAYRADSTNTIKNNNKFLYRDPDNPNAEPVVVLPYGGFYNRTEDLLVSYDFRNTINYAQTFKDELHAINVMAGQQVKYANRQQFSNTGYGYQYDNGGVPFVDYRILKNSIELNFPYYGMAKDYDRFVAFFASGTYTYNRRYNITATGRYDGSNLLGRSRKARWLPTWSVSGSWNIEQEDFMADVAWVDFLTLRGSYGLTASMGPATNSQIVLRNINTNRPYLNERESVIQLANLENSELTWEKQYSANLGVDATLFNKRVNVSVDVYQRKGFDLISIIKTSGVGGEAYKAANYADMEARGAELLIGGLIHNTRDWKWRANLTAGYNVNEITNSQNLPLIWDLVQAEGGNKQGYPVRSLFSLEYRGLNHNNGAPEFIDGEGKQTGNVYLQDQNTGYLVYEGPIDPKLTGGLLNAISYKDFTLSVFITYQAGNKIRMYPAFKNSYTDLDAMPKEFYDRWVMPGDERYTNVPSIMEAFTLIRLDGSTPYNNYNYSTARVARGDMIRLKNVSLTWQVPAKTVKSWGMNSLSFQVVANNPWLLYADKKLQGQDPEFFNTGGVAQPVQKQITLSVRVGL